MLNCESQGESEAVYAWEVQTHDAPVPIIVKGRVREWLSFWKNELKASSFLLDVIEHG